MATNYPDALDTSTELPSNRTDSTPSATNHAEDHNDLAAAVVAIEAELGTNPAGAAATVKARLDAMESGSAANALTGTVGRTSTLLSPVLRDWVSTRDVGLGIDNTGAMDSSAEVDAVLDALETAGGTLHIPDGAIVQMGAIPPRSNVQITGRGPSSQIVSNGDAQGVFTNRLNGQVAVSNFSVTDVAITGPGMDVGTLTDRHCGALIYNATNVNFLRVKVRDFSFHGLALVNIAGGSVKDCDIADVTLDGAGNAIHIGISTVSETPTPQLSHTIVVTGNTVRNCRMACVCIQCSYDTTIPGTYLNYDFIVANNPMLQSVGGATAGFAPIAIECGRVGGVGSTSQGSRIRRGHIHHNTLDYTGPATSAWLIAVSDNNGSAGAQSTDPDEMADITIDHNAGTSTGGGLLCQASRAQIDHNNFTITGTSGVGYYLSGNGDAAHRPADMVLDANIARMPANGSYAFFAGGLDYPSLTNNKGIYATGSTTGAVGGMRVTGCIRPTIANKNHIRNAPKAGLYIDLNTNMACEGNIITNPNETTTAGAPGSGIYYLPPATLGSRETIRFNNVLDSRTTPRMYLPIWLQIANTARMDCSDNSIYGGSAGNGVGAPTEPVWQVNNHAGLASSTAESTPGYPVAITVTASPFVYQNTHSYPVTIAMSGGTVTSLVKRRVNSSHDIIIGATGGDFYLDPGDYLLVTYTAAPTMAYMPVKN